MRWYAAVLVLIVFALAVKVAVGSVPPRPDQPRPDIFEAAGYPNPTMQTLNPVTVKAKAQRTARYRLLTMPGCVAGTIPADMARLREHMRTAVRFDLVADDVAYDFTVRINCGSEQIRLCGGVNVFCLNRGFPFVADVDISDVLSNWQPETRLAILCHEICGHAIGTWNEQYQLCGASCNFAPVPGWRDFMGTGPLSRHGFEQIELERWERTMYPLTEAQLCVTDPCWSGSRWVFRSGWSYAPATDAWYEPAGRLYWQAADVYGWRYCPVCGVDAAKGLALPGGTPYWHAETATHLRVP